MKKRQFSFLVVAFFSAMVVSAQVATVAVKGAEVGKWTQDYAAAKKLAVEKKLPLLLNFTGSDWCYWCKLMDKQVFSKDEWKTWASDKIVLAFINFPKNQKLVPKEYVDRNQALQKEFRVRGYPTYILLYTDGARVWGSLEASPDATPKSFIEDIEKIIAKEPKAGPFAQ